MGFGERRGILMTNINFRGARTGAGEGWRAFRPTVAEMPHEGWPTYVGTRAIRQLEGRAHLGCDRWRDGKGGGACRAIDAGQRRGNLAVAPKLRAGNGDGLADA